MWISLEGECYNQLADNGGGGEGVVSKKNFSVIRASSLV